MTQLEPKTVKEFLTTHVRTFKVRQGSSAKLERYNDEYIIIRELTIEYMNAKRECPARLQDVKDVLVYHAKQVKANVHNLDLEGGANAKIQVDMKKLSKGVFLYEGHKVDIAGKELDKNAVVMFDITTAGKMIADEKDKAKQTALKQRFDRIIKLPTREGYGVNSP